MQITTEKNDNELIIALEGSLDTLTSRDLENELKTSINDIESLIIDMEKLDYVSSAGLRVLFKAYKTVSKKGKMTLKNVKPEVLEVLQVTGFDNVFNIE
ncbi:MAG: STAS domain-containing protein [Synergistaceae bacterium]|nr:STAS domain-containing protein [Synergistaceae bacterium]